MRIHTITGGEVCLVEREPISALARAFNDQITRDARLLAAAIGIGADVVIDRGVAVHLPHAARHERGVEPNHLLGHRRRLLALARVAARLRLVVHAAGERVVVAVVLRRARGDCGERRGDLRVNTECGQL